MDKKKLSAAMAAVYAYIKTSEEAGMMTEIPELVPEFVETPAQVQNNIWGISGRQAHMQTNTMMQLRLFK